MRASFHRLASKFRYLLRGRAMVALGAAAGALGAAALGRFVESPVFGLKPDDLTTIVASVAVMLAVGVLAGYLPARRAARIDPLVALRQK